MNGAFIRLCQFQIKPTANRLQHACKQAASFGRANLTKMSPAGLEPGVAHREEQGNVVARISRAEAGARKMRE